MRRRRKNKKTQTQTKTIGFRAKFCGFESRSETTPGPPTTTTGWVCSARIENTQKRRKARVVFLGGTEEGGPMCSACSHYASFY